MGSTWPLGPWYRVEPDPHQFGLNWRYYEGRLMALEHGHWQFTFPHEETPERLVLWLDLALNPFDHA